MRSDDRDYPSPRSTPRPTHDRANHAAYEHAVEQIVEHATSPAYKKNGALALGTPKPSRYVSPDGTLSRTRHAPRAAELSPMRRSASSP